MSVLRRLAVLCACWLACFSCGIARAQDTIATLPDLKLSRGGEVRAAVVQADGKIIIGGAFESVNGVQRFGLARLNVDGSVDLTWTAEFSGRFAFVTVLLLSGDTLYVGGSFSDLGGFTRQSLARLSISAGGAVDPLWQPFILTAQGGSGFVAALALSGNALFVGGSFDSAGGLRRKNLAKLSTLGTGRADARWNVPVAGAVPGFEARSPVVTALLVEGGQLYVGGVYRSLGGRARSSLARVSTTGRGAVDPAWAPEARRIASNGRPAAGAVYALARAPGGGSVLVAGDFTTIARAARPHAAKLSTAAGAALLDAAWDPALQFPARALAIAGSQVFIGGNGSAPGTSTNARAALVKVDAATGDQDPAWQIAFDLAPVTELGAGSVLTLALSGSSLYVGGGFEGTGNRAAPGLARLNVFTAELDELFDARPELRGNATAIAEQPDGKLIVAGNFIFGGGLPRRHILRLERDGTVDATWNPGVNGSVLAIAVAGDGIFVGGLFDTAGGESRQNLAKLSANTGDRADPGWQADCDSLIYALATDATDLFVGGAFQEIGGLALDRLAKVSLGAGVVDATWVPDIPSINVTALALHGTDLFVGIFGQPAGMANPVKVSTQGAGAVDATWNPQTSNTGNGLTGVFSLALRGNDLFVGGVFSQIGGQARRGLAKLGVASPAVADPAWNARLGISPGFTAITGIADAQVFRIAISGSAVYVTGGFDRVGAPAVLRGGVAKLNADGDGAFDPAWHPGAAVSGGVPPNFPQALFARGDDLFITGEEVGKIAPFGTTYLIDAPSRAGFALLPTAAAPVLLRDPANPTRLLVLPNPHDGFEVTHFQITGLTGGVTLTLSDGVTPVAVGDFISLAEGQAGLPITPGPSGPQFVTAKAAVNDTAAGAGAATTQLDLGAGASVPVFELSVAGYSIREGDGALTITVRDLTGLAGTVSYTLTDGSARQGIDYTAAPTGTLDFAAGETEKTIVVPIANDVQFTGDRNFRIALAATAPGVAGRRSTAEIRIVENDLIAGRTGSVLDATAPQPGATPSGAFRVTLSPPAASGQWRLAGEFLWHDSGETVTGLVPGAYTVEFRKVLNFVEPFAITALAQAGTVDLAATYLTAADPVMGRLKVDILPAFIATAATEAERGQWRREGEATWHDSGEILTLNAGEYTIEFKAVSGYPAPGFAAPDSLIVSVGGGDDPANLPLDTVTGVYTSAVLVPGALTPAPLSFTQVRDERPYQFCGQIKTELGLGSGFVVDRYSVLTVGHVLFDDLELTNVRDVQWLFQKHRDSHEPAPITPRGWFLFEGYAAQRTTDRQPPRNFEVNEASPESRNFDVAVMFFDSNRDSPGRNGFGGFLISDLEQNEFLTGAASKILAGYPVRDIPAGDRGKLHATAPGTYAFTRANGRVFTTLGAQGFEGMSGAPLLVQHANGQYYPAAVYLGGSSETLVRALDSDVLGLINRAQRAATGGGNSTGGGATLVSPGVTGGSFSPTQLQVIINPPEVRNTARWRVEGRSFQKSGAVIPVEPNEYPVIFTRVPGKVAPVLRARTFAGQTTTVAATYRDGVTINISSDNGAQGTVGTGPGDQRPSDSIDVVKNSTATFLAVAAPNFAFDFWEVVGFPALNHNAARFPLEATQNYTLIAHFIPGPFFPYRGTYTGFLENSGDPDAFPDGSFTITVTGTGTYTGSAFYLGRRFALRGKFELSGVAAGVLPGTNPPIEFTLLIDLQSGTRQVTGNLFTSAGENVATLITDRAIDAPPSRAGSYTLRLPTPAPGPGDPALPTGQGAATMNIDSRGQIRLTGVLADGTPFKATTRLIANPASQTNPTFPLFIPLYGNQGSLAGTATFDPQPTSDLAGTLRWVRPQILNAPRYPDGWPAGVNIPLLGSTYTAPHPARPNQPAVLPLPNLPPADPDGNILLTATGGNQPGLTRSLNLTPTGRFTPLTPNDPTRLALTLTPATGFLTGSFQTTAPPRARQVRAVLFQKTSTAHGALLGPSETGEVTIVLQP